MSSIFSQPMSEPSNPSGVELFGGDCEIAEQPAELHALRGPMRVLGLWYVTCSCAGGWVSEAKDSAHAALGEVCAFEAAGVKAIRNRHHFARALRNARLV